MVLTFESRELNAHQKAGLITMLLQQGNRLTTDGVARLTGLSWDGADYMMEALGGVLPIVRINGLWQWMSKD